MKYKSIGSAHKQTKQNSNSKQPR